MRAHGLALPNICKEIRNQQDECVSNMTEGSEDVKLVADLINAKLKLLKFTRDKTGSITTGSIITAMERHLKALNTVLDDVDALRRNMNSPNSKRAKNRRRLQNGAQNWTGS
jgi:hypothetical protein